MFIRRINVILSREFYRHYSDLSMIIIPEVSDRRLLITAGLSMLRVIYKPMTIKIDIIVIIIVIIIRDVMIRAMSVIATSIIIRDTMIERL